ncbi:hypothetical protein P7K49_017753 [Saguinus oedipus]|uniref:Ribonuclease K6 n=1 Tax=Saguinus oedipus TaxID=9490 RepID=A0ABQ9V637_SAGOE|nr:hypothetical protein P7K49_017753 [Saguinus oedipus]
MSHINNYTQHCKPQNTFLHDSFQNVAAVCDLLSITCKNGLHNCHQSLKPVNMTDCRLTSGKYPQCRYSAAAQYKLFIVACDPPQKGDPPYKALCLPRVSLAMQGYTWTLHLHFLLYAPDEGTQESCGREGERSRKPELVNVQIWRKQNSNKE